MSTTKKTLNNTNFNHENQIIPRDYKQAWVLLKKQSIESETNTGYEILKGFENALEATYTAHVVEKEIYYNIPFRCINNIEYEHLFDVIEEITFKRTEQWLTGKFVQRTEEDDVVVVEYEGELLNVRRFYEHWECFMEDQ